MADSTTQLDRIAHLVDKLTPVGRKMRGMRIEADDWNVVVDVALGILQIDRLQELRTTTLIDRLYAPADHEHLGQVNIAWLDTDLQSRFGGTGSSVATRQALAGMDGKIQSLAADFNRLSMIVALLQKVVDDSQVKEVDRSKTLLDFDRRFKGLGDLKTLVTSLSGDVGAIRANVDKVLDLRKSLQDDAGNPIDMAGIRQDVADLQLLGTNLNGADGKPIRMRDIEMQIQDIATVVGTSGAGGLDARFAALSSSIQETVNAKAQALIDQSQAALRAEIGAGETRLRAAIDASSSQTRDAVQQQLAAQLANTETKFNSTLDARLGALAADIRQNALNATTTLLNQRLAEIPDQVRTQVATAVNGLQGALTADLRATLTATVTSQVKDAEARLNQQIANVQASAAALKQSMPDLVAGQVAGALPGLQATLAREVADQVAAAQQVIQASVATTVKASVAASLQDLDARIATAVGQQTASIGARVNEAVTAATKDLPDQVSGEVKAQLAALNVDGRIADSAKALTMQLRSELRSAIADEDARTSAAVQSAVTLLQGQLAAAVASAVKEARDFAAAQTNNLRTELNNIIDSKLKTMRDTLSEDFATRLRATHEQLSTDIQSVRTLQTRPLAGPGGTGMVIR